MTFGTFQPINSVHFFPRVGHGVGQTTEQQSHHSEIDML
jgi:hypothetical protein